MMRGEGSKGQALAVGRGERFDCPRCGYARPLKPGEDGFYLYVVHQERCIPSVGRQLWFPFITEDDLNRFPWEEERMRLSGGPEGEFFIVISRKRG